MISYKVPEEQWTEKIIKTLPSEDDRFEYTENIDTAKIEQEICAFANSFGGTLFLGIEDKNISIKGVEKMKGNKPMTLWLEQKIPVLLEFRFGSFRVREVKLTAATQKKIGSNKTVISIDIFDSDMTPYQVVQTRKYYRRENSSAKEAPHSYLAYLWSRSSSEKTNVVQHWIREFLTPLISFTQNSLYEFQHLKFFGQIENPGSQSFYVIQYNNSKKYNELLNSRSANQFLRTYIKLSPQIDNLSNAFEKFENFISDFIHNILEDKALENVVRELYKDCLSRQRPPVSYDESKHPLMMLSALVGIHGISSLAENQNHLIRFTSRYLAYVFFDFQLKTTAWGDSGFIDFCKSLLDKLKDHKNFIEKKENLKLLTNNVILEAEKLFDEADTLREELCLRHNTIY